MSLPHAARRFLQLAAGIAVAGLCCAAIAAPLRVAGRFLQDAHGNVIQLRGVNVPVYKSGFDVSDLDAVATAVASTQANAVRFEWWVNGAPGTAYTTANLDAAIQKYYDHGIIAIVDLHDLTFQSDPVAFASTITGFWTRPDVVAVLVKHQDHVIVNVANEWGDPAAASAYLSTYATSIAAIRNAGIIAPLMIDAPEGFQYQFLLDHGQEVLDLDPMHDTLLSVHAYWAASDPSFTDPNVIAIIDALAQSGLPFVLGEASSNAFTNIPCDPIHYGNLLTRANADGIGYLFWAWYEDGQCGQDMNITFNADGVTLPSLPGFGYDAIHAAGYGIDAAQPATRKADFSAGSSASADMSLTNVLTSPNPASTGRDVVFALTVSNNGPSAADNVAVSVAYDPSANAIWASPGCARQGTLALYSCTFGTMAPGITVHYKLVLRRDGAGTTYANATATSSATDPSLANNGANVSVAVNASPAASAVLRYRLYSPVTLEHLYTTDLNEYNTLGGFVGTWNQEGTVGHVLDNPGSFNGVTATPYYRLYNTATSWHHWTTDPNEYYTLIQFPNWNAEGVDGWILPTAAPGSTQLYRLLYPFIPGLHHWTIDANEYNTLISTYGWTGEGGSGYVIP